jgi:hypothetical protein
VQMPLLIELLRGDGGYKKPRPNQLLTWWDMKPFDVKLFLWVARNFQIIINDQSAHGEAVVEETRKTFSSMLDEYIKACEEIGLTSTADQFKRVKEATDDAKVYGEISQFLPEVLNRLEDECARKIVMSIDSAYVAYLDEQHFDSKDQTAPKVSAQFASAADDIAEAGTCLACARSTACVMHLGRVMEIGLKSLAGAVGVSHQNDWGRYLTKIDEELQSRIKSAGARSADEQFYAEAHIMFDSVRRAWRNPAMHTDRVYTMERAEEILIAVRSFMRHLATKLHD